MQTTGDFVAATAKLSPSVEDREDRFQSGLTSLALDVDRNPPSVVANGNTVIRVDFDVDFSTKTGQGFVDPVVDDFPNQVVQPLGLGRTDVHSGPLTNSV